MQTTIPATMNIFAAATTKPAAKSKAKEKEVIETPELEGSIARFHELKAQVTNAETEMKMLEANIKEVGRAAWIAKYKKDRKRPESFRIADRTESSALLLIMDKYLKVEDEKRGILESIDPELVENKTTYSFSPEMLEKHGQAISDAIMGLPIPDEDKAALLVKEENWTVRKGSIERLAQYEDMETVFTLIAPIVQLKGK